MKIFISDLHLGDGSRTDDFHRDRELLEFFEFVESQAQELIILGDFLELWQADLDRVIFRHSEVINRLLTLRKKVKVTFVIGNHDYIPFVKFADAGAGICLEYRDSENRIVAEHGHKYDTFNHYKNPLKSIKWPPGKHFTLLVASLERLIHPDVDKWTRKAMENLDDFLQEALFIRNKITPATEEYFIRGGHFGEFEQAVNNHINKGAKIVIFGHIHKCQLKTVGKGIYANCGSWVDNVKPTYVACHRDRIELKEALTHNVIKWLTLKSEG
ncbi:MAG: UDP-2,3-diacylglucosamine diphosphatase [Candidatus Omnitrophica bacterium]|nr:UDP-2,3-diacylglucosamine diphosphatase [Candidatus Omnitrophota bacterium]